MNIIIKTALAFLCAQGYMFLFAMNQSNNPQILDVCLRFKKQEIPSGTVNTDIQEKLKTFGIFDSTTTAYVSVIAARTTDCLDHCDCVHIKKDLKRDIPYIIQKDLLKLNAKKQKKVLQKYIFPDIVPQSVIRRIESNQSIIHELYKNDKTNLLIRYRVKEVKEKINNHICLDANTKKIHNHDQAVSVLDHDYIYFGVLFLSLLTIAHQ